MKYTVHDGAVLAERLCGCKAVRGRFESCEAHIGHNDIEKQMLENVEWAETDPVQRAILGLHETPPDESGPCGF